MWMDFMKAEIANKPNEFFPAEGAPKKTLNVAAVAKPAAPAKPAEDEEEREASGSTAPH
jgi:penicillin-binding protein 1A